MTATALFAIAALLAAVAAAAAPGAQPPRTCARFDDGWRFHRGDVPDAWKADVDDGQWRAVDLPHDWAIEDLPPADAEGIPAIALTPGEWRFSPGDDPGWKEPAFDDTAWKVAMLPSYWREQLGGAGSHAYGWYRRRFVVPSEARGKDVLLLLGKVDDCDETFVNGVKVGGMGSFPPSYGSAWEASRRYRVPASLLKGDGTDVVAVRVYNGDGEGGLYAAVAAPRRSGPFDTDADGGTAQGYTVQGVGWYRKAFTLPAAARGRNVYLTFDGVYMDATIWLNGVQIARHPYGYTSFHVDIGPQARFGRERNVLAVKVDASGRTSRWYSGAGIYRHVWLTTTGPVRIAAWGVEVSTPDATAARATVATRVTVLSPEGKTARLTVAAQVLDATGRVVAQDTAAGAAGQAGGSTLTLAPVVQRPKRWSPGSPTLYRLVVTLSMGGKVVDRVETPFGIRTVGLDAVHGFTLNGRPLKLRGGCVHHDNGCLGSRTYDRAEERRVEVLKAAGFNAIRTSHNPPSPAFLDACDRLGVLVMDEAFDCWRQGKNPQDYGRFFDEWWRRDVASMVERDRNHPCVVMWSIGNEIPEQTTPEGAGTAATLADCVRTLDASGRPVTQAAFPDGANWEKLDALFAPLDAAGYNYMPGKYVPDHERVPNRVIAGTESFPQAAFESWMGVVDHPWVIGDFVWTALDYLGEAGLGQTVPQGQVQGYAAPIYTVSNCGDLDLCGWQRPQSVYRQVLWGVGPKVACFTEQLGPNGQPKRVEGWGWPDEAASWTWPGMEGTALPVRVYSRCPRVRLLLDGRDLGAKDTTRDTRWTAQWEVPYAPGELVAVGLDARGAEVARVALRTAGPPAAIRLAPDRSHLAADGQDLSFVTVEVVDANGRLCPNAGALVRFRLNGAGRIAAVGSADPCSMESFQQPQRTAYRGRCLVVLQAGTRAGELRLRADADGLKGAEVAVTVGKASSR